jgi:hypothetical protein
MEALRHFPGHSHRWLAGRRETGSIKQLLDLRHPRCSGAPRYRRLPDASPPDRDARLFAWSWQCGEGVQSLDSALAVPPTPSPHVLRTAFARRRLAAGEAPYARPLCRMSCHGSAPAVDRRTSSGVVFQQGKARPGR